MIALMGASEAVLSPASSVSVEEGPEFERRFQPTRPMIVKKPGIQSFLAAATAMRLATKELPSKEPATTRQTRTAVTMPKPRPKRRVMAVYSHKT